MTPQPRSPLPRRAISLRVRLLSLALAGLVCYTIAAVAGYSLHQLTMSKPRPAPVAPPLQQPIQTDPTVARTVDSAPAPQEVAPVSAAPVAPSIVLAPAGEASVPGGEVVLGGGDTGLPLHRVLVEPFAIAGTETTNEQYAEFVRKANHRTPDNWPDGKHPSDAADKPVTNVTWQDTVDYCAWLSKELGVEVRLPTEAEWVLAARGREGRSYPWGNEWDDARAASMETDGEVRPVKSYPKGNSPFGAYDMAGNVWEWTAEPVRDERGTPRVINGIKLVLVMGGAANESRANISATARQRTLTTTKSPMLGFRYVIIRKTAQASAVEKKSGEPDTQR